MFDPHTDSIGRRRPASKRKPTGDTEHVNERDLDILAWVHAMGGMQSTETIFEYAVRKGHYKPQPNSTRPMQMVQKRLYELYHNEGLYERAQVQKKLINARYYHVVHTVSKKGLELLKERGLYYPNAPRAHGWFEHQKMSACLYSSFFLNCMDAGIPFTPQHELKGEPHLTVTMERDRKLIPDAVFTFNPGSELLVFLEADRGTEPGKTTGMRKNVRDNILEYKQVIGKELYKEHFGVDCKAVVLIVTTKDTMKEKILAHIAEIFPNGCSYIAVHQTDSFGMEYNNKTYIDLLGTSWERWKYPPIRFIHR